MTTITINSSTYDVYADVAMAEEYLQAAIQTDDWDAATTTVKSKALVTATRILDRQKWKGDKVDESQPSAFPRTEDIGTPQAIIDASIELANLLVSGSDVQSAQNQSQKIRSAGAGSAMVSFFRGAEGYAYRFPLIVQELVGPYLASSVGGDLGSEANDVDGCATDIDFGLSAGF